MTSLFMMLEVRRCLLFKKNQDGKLECIWIANLML